MGVVIRPLESFEIDDDAKLHYSPFAVIFRDFWQVIAPSGRQDDSDECPLIEARTKVLVSQLGIDDSFYLIASSTICVCNVLVDFARHP